MTDLSTAASHEERDPRSTPSPTSAARGNRLRKATRIYVVLAVCASALIIAGHAAGDRIEQAERQGSLAMMGAGRDPGSALQRQPGPTGLTGPRAPTVSPTAAKPLAIEDTPAANPAWVQVIRGTQTWASPGGRDVVSTVSQWQFLRVQAATDTRFRVANPEGSPPEVWIDLADVALSGAPPSWVRSIQRTPLYASADGTDEVNQVESGVDLMVAGETQGTRSFVYMPG